MTDPDITIPSWFRDYLKSTDFKNIVATIFRSHDLGPAQFTPVNLAGNLAKVEGNLFAVQADVIRVDAVVKGWVADWLGNRAAVRSLKDKANLLPQSKMEEIRAMTKKDVLELLSPEKLRLDMEAMDADLSALENEVRRLKGRPGPSSSPDGRPAGPATSRSVVVPKAKEIRTEAERLERAAKQLTQAITDTTPVNLKLLRTINQVSDGLK
jgi:hypothetical protein